MKFVLLDKATINPGDLDWEPLAKWADEIEYYDDSKPDEIPGRIADAEVIMTSKCLITREIMSGAPKLKYIGVTATGYNNIDLEAAAELGIAVTNVPSYSTKAVAQHAIALMLEITNSVGLHNESVQSGEWATSEYFCYWKKPIVLLAGKSLGIIGYGEIGKTVAEIAKALGMEINIYSRDPEAAIKSDFVSLHCPLTEQNAKMINADFLSKMKEGAVLINTARGGLVDEEALANALKSGHIAAAAVDVIAKEPPTEGNPLFGLDNCIVTPHIAWAPKEMRELVIKILGENVSAWMDGRVHNRVEPKGLI